jgi:hypothetical protein
MVDNGAERVDTLPGTPDLIEVIADERRRQFLDQSPWPLQCRRFTRQKP